MLDAARSLGVDIDSVCGGRGICGRCQVTQGLGAFPKHGIVSEPDHLSAFAALETTYREEKGLAADRRLSCTAQVCGDVLIDVPPESQVHRQVVRKGLDVRTFIVDPVVRLHYVEVTPPELGVADRRPGTAVRGARARVAADRSRGGPAGRARPPAGAREGEVRGHRRGPPGTPGHRRSGPASTRRPTASRSTSARRRSPATSPTWPTARSSPATA